MEPLQHFSHDHLLTLVHLQQLDGVDKNSDDEEEEEKEEDESNFVMEDPYVGRCDMCMEQIYLFHMFYYKCMECDLYSLHKFCAELPLTFQNHVSHPGHNLTLSKGFQFLDYHFTSDWEWTCRICNIKRKNFYNYHCSICKFNMDIICATQHKQKMNNPSHPHQLQRMPISMVSTCSACCGEHKGTFYQCTTCLWFLIHLDCALLPKKLLIQQHTNETFIHSHPLTLDYSFPFKEQQAKFFPTCIVCGVGFNTKSWFYKCDKCRYYTHVDCATSMRDSFMSILLPPGRGKTYKNFGDKDHPNIFHCPFPDESYNLVKHHFSNQMDFRVDENYINMHSHQHPLILFDMQASLENKPVSLHNPMKKTQLLCDGCVKPITTMPFYKCCLDIQNCGFVLHEWCGRLPSEIHGHPGHPQHTLILLRNIPKEFFVVFQCAICLLLSNGFAYGCIICKYYVDINCAFLPTEITHESHPKHLLSIIKNGSANSLSEKVCRACSGYIMNRPMALHCYSCDFYLHIQCAFLLPSMIKHKFDKHPLSLRYNPVENHVNEYFCEICEEEFNPQIWFYHCTACGQSMHPSCAPLILKCEQAVYSRYKHAWCLLFSQCQVWRYN